MRTANGRLHRPRFHQGYFSPATFKAMQAAAPAHNVTVLQSTLDIDTHSRPTPYPDLVFVDVHSDGRDLGPFYHEVESRLKEHT